MDLPQSAVEKILVNYEVVKDCWEWKGKKDKDGYGRLRVGGRITIRTNRAAWIVANGEIPNGKMICHKCDNPCCINPDHLYVGTAKDNATDRRNRGRSNNERGSLRWNSKLTEEQVRQISIDYVPGKDSQTEVAKKYGVSQATISHILRGANWKHVGVLPNHNMVKTMRKKQSKLGQDEKNEIRVLYQKEKISQRELADKFHVSQQTISNIITCW